jgi:hypothetical protein
MAGCSHVQRGIDTSPAADAGHRHPVLDSTEQRHPAVTAKRPGQVVVNGRVEPDRALPGQLAAAK